MLQNCLSQPAGRMLQQECKHWNDWALNSGPPRATSELDTMCMPGMTRRFLVSLQTCRSGLKWQGAHRADVQVPSSSHGNAGSTPDSQNGAPHEGAPRRELRQQPIALYQGGLQGCMLNLGKAPGFKCRGQPLRRLRHLLGLTNGKDGCPICIPPADILSSWVRRQLCGSAVMVEVHLCNVIVTDGYAILKHSTETSIETQSSN